MGCPMSTPKDPKSVASQSRSDEIDAEISKARREEDKSIKILLLGSGESGKSTVLKQMKIMQRGPFTQPEREAYKDVIFVNTIQSMKVILEAMEVLEIPMEASEASEAGELVLHTPDQVGDSGISPAVVQAITTLWTDGGVQLAFSRSREYQLNDSASYYFDSIARIGSSGYVPTDQDVLRTRVKTTGIIEEKFTMDDGAIFHIVDVGGQRSERRKWIHCFEGVTAVLFLAALSEYDQMLYEDSTVPRMKEALTLFESIANSRWFVKSSLLLFLNKTDLFQAKLSVSPLHDYFPDYKSHPEADTKSEEEYRHAAAFFTQKFTSLAREPRQTIYHYLTCATDTNQIHFVLKAVQDIVTRHNLRSVGLF